MGQEPMKNIKPPNDAPLGKNTLPLAALGDASQSGTPAGTACTRSPAMYAGATLAPDLPSKSCVRCSAGVVVGLPPVGTAARALRAVRQFARLEAGSVKVALSRPTHQRVTPAVNCNDIRYTFCGLESSKIRLNLTNY
jgi:hypothetical protein